MFRKLILILSAVLCSAVMFAQPAGGVKGTVVNRAGRLPIGNAEIVISPYGSTETVAQGTADSEGKFLFTGLEDGMYNMLVKAPGYADANVNVTVEGHIKDLIFVSMVGTVSVNEVSDESFAEFDMDDSGFNDNPTILFGSNDPYSQIASFGFSSIRFKNRGYSSESQDVYLSGIKMNDAITGYSPYSLWSGLNEAMRDKDSFMGNETTPYGLGTYNGLTNISGQPEDMRPGWRFSLLSNSALYRLRVMASYASGQLDNGWSYAFNVSARLGGNDYVKGVYYRSFAYYAAAQKKFGDVHKLSLVAFGTPGNRGAQNASTQEVYDLMGDNMYNSNWGYQAGKVRNARVRKTHEPVFILKYTATPNENLETSATVLYRTGRNGYTALDWYDAADPRPDYYRNLPSYFWHENEDYGRLNEDKYYWALETWQSHDKNLTHINWDRLYNVNRNSIDDRYSTELTRSKYAQEERRVDQNDVNLAWNLNWRVSDYVNIQGGLNYKWNRTEYYKKMADLLGGDYYVDMDQFAERDFSQTPEMFQNDLDYYLENGTSRIIGKGDKYGYDYYAHVQNANAWANVIFTDSGLTANLSGRVGYAGFYREGLVRKGLFPGLSPEGNEYFTADGTLLTTYDDVTGEVVTSKGKSKKSHFLEYAVKGSMQYDFTGGHRLYATVGYFHDAPKFNQAFISPRTRNSLIHNLKPIRTLSSDINYEYSNAGYDLRVTGFYTSIQDQTDVMSFYDDSQKSFVNFAMTGIDQRHIGLEVGFKIPLFVDGLSLVGAVSYGDYVYTSTPRMTQTIDNSASVVRRDVPVTYWKGHWSYKKDENGNYLTDEYGDYVADKYHRHYVPSTPQLATDLGLKLFLKSYWFFEVHGQFFANSYLDMNPLYRIEEIVYGPKEIFDPASVEHLASQEKFNNAFLLNISIGKSWYIKRKYNIGFSLQGNNLTHRLAVKTGGYEQTRLITGQTGTRYYKFDSKYFYMPGANYMLNLYFRF